MRLTTIRLAGGTRDLIATGAPAGVGELREYPVGGGTPVTAAEGIGACTIRIVKDT